MKLSRLVAVVALATTSWLAAAPATAQPTAPAAGAAAPAPTADMPPAPVAPAPAPTAAAPAPTAAAPDTTSSIRWEVVVRTPKNDIGSHLTVTFKRTPSPGRPAPNLPVLVLRRPATAADTASGEIRANTDYSPTLSPDFLYGPPTGAEGEAAERGSIDTNEVAVVEKGKRLGRWTVVGLVTPDATGGGSIDDEPGIDQRVVYALLPTRTATEPGTLGGFIGAGVVTTPRVAQGAWFNTERWFYLALVLMIGAAFAIYVGIAKRAGDKLFIRRIAGVDAIEDAIGRSTEMGRPVLYVTGVEEIQDIQTIASLLILGHVAEMTATYDTEIKVANTYPMTMIVAEEIVRAGYNNAGRPDAHKPENVMFITSEQFAFAAAVNGMILRDQPAANIYLGRFFAESLMLAETGFLTGAVQIAGTAEFTQLPFFIAACDHTLIGEELYATSAYLSRDPVQLAQLKAGDVMKVVIFVMVVVGVASTTIWHHPLIQRLIDGQAPW